MTEMELGSERSISILLVEDLEDHAVLMRRRLMREMPKALVRRVASLEQALTCIERMAFDIILLDLGLPDAEGVEAVTTLRHADASIIVVTSDQSEDAARAVLRAGATDFVCKDDIGTLRFSRLLAIAAERRQLERSLQRRTVSLETVVFALGHELSAPPRQLRFLLSKALDELRRDAPSARDTLIDADDAAVRMQRIVSSALTLARVEISRQERRPCRLRDVVESALDACAGDAASRVNVSGDCDAQADPELLVIAIRNLVDNALRYSPQDEAVEVKLSDGEEVLISVLDRGPGIDPLDAPRLFLPGVRGPASHGEDAPHGTGFGLCITRQIARLHGGDVEISSRLDGGSVFTMTLATAARSSEALA